MGSKDSGMGSSQEGANLAENLKESERSWKTLPFSLLSKPMPVDVPGGGGKCFVIVCVYCTVLAMHACFTLKVIRSCMYYYNSKKKKKKAGAH